MVCEEDIKNHLMTKFNLSQSQIEQMLPGFIDTLKEHLEKVSAAVVGGDGMALGRAAHAMKGALLNLGLDEAAGMAFLLEENARNGKRTAEYFTQLARLRENLSSLVK